MEAERRSIVTVELTIWLKEKEVPILIEILDYAKNMIEGKELVGNQNNAKEIYNIVATIKAALGGKSEKV